MNLDLNTENEVLFAASEVVKSLAVDQETGETVSSDLPALQKVLNNIGPLPATALFLGLADDGLPVLLDLWNPAAGPILVAGDSQTGKTGFLKTIIRFVNFTRHPQEIQYSVIANSSSEWEGYADDPHCLGIFPAVHKRVTQLTRALAAWIEINQTSRQSVLLLIDGLDDFIFWNRGLDQELQKILLYGPAKKVWPVISINLETFQNVDWLKFFHTRVFGYTKYSRIIIKDDGNCHQGLDSLSKGVEFRVKKNSQWIHFRIPRR